MNKQFIILGILVIMTLILYSGATIKYSDSNSKVNTSNNDINNANNDTTNNKKRQSVPFDENRMMRKDEILKGILNDQLAHMKGRYYYDNCRFDPPKVNM